MSWFDLWTRSIEAIHFSTQLCKRTLIATDRYTKSGDKISSRIDTL